MRNLKADGWLAPQGGLGNTWPRKLGTPEWTGGHLSGFCIFCNNTHHRTRFYQKHGLMYNFLRAHKDYRGILQAARWNLGMSGPVGWDPCRPVRKRGGFLKRTLQRITNYQRTRTIICPITTKRLIVSCVGRTVRVLAAPCGANSNTASRITAITVALKQCATSSWRRSKSAGNKTSICMCWLPWMCTKKTCTNWN